MTKPTLNYPIFYSAQIRRMVTQLSTLIKEHYKDIEEPVVAIVILKGSLFFAADLIRKLSSSIDIELDTIALSSYGNCGSASGMVRLDKDIGIDITNRHVLFIEDIVDSGKTIKYIQGLFQYRNPASLKIVSLLSKPNRREVEVEIDFLGAEVQDHFLVGYGLDYNEMFRCLPDIHTVSVN